MLVLLSAVAIIVSLLLETALHHLTSNYEIEWTTPEDSGNDVVQAIADTLNESLRESERQMNTAFKVASGARW